MRGLPGPAGTGGGRARFWLAAAPGWRGAAGDPSAGRSPSVRLFGPLTGPRSAAVQAAAGGNVPAMSRIYARLVNRRGKCCNVRGREAGDRLDVISDSIRPETLVLRGTMK